MSEGRNPVLKVQNPVLWNAENPYLYTLILKGGNEVIAKKVCGSEGLSGRC